MPFSLRKKIISGKRQKLLFGILFIGYVALLGTHSVFQLSDNSSFQNTVFYSAHANQELNIDQYKPVTDQKNTSVHAKMNKHFDTEKLFFIIPSVADAPEFITSGLRSLFDDRNYFTSAFLFTTDGRGPPCAA